MIRQFVISLSLAWLLFTNNLRAQEQLPTALGIYEYETKPDIPELAKFNPRRAPKVGELILVKGDRLAICGDSITEQKMYSRIIETYLTVCVPELEITARQYGWSGEKCDGFLRRMERDCLTFTPTIATICYGMNDARYRPFDITNGRWYEDHLTAIVRNFKDAGARVVVGSPGCSGKIANWVQSRSGTLDEHNLNLCALRDIAIEVAEAEQISFADIFWPMYQAQFTAPQKYPQPEGQEPYAVAGRDGIHPGWAGQVIMAYSFLRAMGLKGDVGTFVIDVDSDEISATEGHTAKSIGDQTFEIISSRYPFCAVGEVDKDDSIRSGMTLVSFMQDLSRLTLQVKSDEADEKLDGWIVHWGEQQKQFTKAELTKGINLADHFIENPFSAAFAKVDQCVAEKQAYETQQVKKAFHSAEAKKNFSEIVTATEAERQPLADAIQAAFVPVTHQIRLVPVTN